MLNEITCLKTVCSKPHSHIVQPKKLRENLPESQGELSGIQQMETTFYQGFFPSMCCDRVKRNANPYVLNSFPERLSVYKSDFVPTEHYEAI